MIEVAEHYQFPATADGIQHWPDVIDDHRIAVDVEQVFATQRPGWIEQFHLRPPAVQFVAVFQRQGVNAGD